MHLMIFGSNVLCKMKKFTNITQMRKHESLLSLSATAAGKKKLKVTLITGYAIETFCVQNLQGTKDTFSLMLH